MADYACAACGNSLADGVSVVLRVQIDPSNLQAVGWCPSCQAAAMHDLAVVGGCGGWAAWLRGLAERGDLRAVRLPLTPGKKAAKAS